MIETATATKLFQYIVSGEIVKAFDTSRHNHPLTREYPNGVPINFAEAYANEYRVWMGRLAVGNYYTDAWFQPDLIAARAAGFICLAYFVSTPEYPDDEQLERFLRALGNQRIDGVVLDAELSRGQTPVRVTACNQYLADRFSEMYSRVWLYTGPSFADTYLLSDLGLPLFIANPGPGNGMNPNPMPAMPERYEDDDYIAWQKDWKHAIPGVPDTTNDYTEVQMSEAEARAYFGMEESEEDEMAIEQKLDDILTNQGVIISNQGIILQYLHDGAQPPVEPPTPPAPPVPPEPGYAAQVVVTKTNARWSKAKNANGAPIMTIYPRDNAPVSERIQFFEDDFLRVVPEKIRADGGVQYYELATIKGRDGETLYIKAADVMKTW